MPRPLLVIHTAGSQVQMGRQHAEILREYGGYRAATDYYPRLAWRMLAAGTHTRAERAAIKALRPAFDAAVHRLFRDRPQDLQDRSTAFYQALTGDPNLARYVSVMDVFQNAVGLLGRMGLIPHLAKMARAPGCSTLMAWHDGTRDGRLLHARNFDFPGVGVWDEAPAVVFCRPREGLRYGFLTMRGADVPGVSAFNEAGICVTAHTRLHRAVSTKGASIVDIGHEVARRASTLEQAIAIAGERPCASTWGLAISSAREHTAAVVELTAHGARAIPAKAGEPYHCTANLYAHPDHQAGEIAPNAAWVHDCAGRAKSLRRHGARRGHDVASMWSMLGDHADPDHPEHLRAGGACLAAPYTVQSLVADLSMGQLHTSVGSSPTGHGAYATLDLDFGAPVGGRTLEASTPPTNPSRYASSEAHCAYVEAVRLEQRAAPRPELRAALERAASLDPDESSYLFLAGVARLSDGEVQGAREALSAALEHEPNRFRRGQIHLWAARANDLAGARAEAVHHRARLLDLDHPHLGPLKRRARQERPLSLRHAARIAIHPALVEATL